MTVPIAVAIDIGAVVLAGRLAVDRHLEAYRITVGTGTEDEVQIAGAEPVGDATAGVD